MTSERGHDGAGPSTGPSVLLVAANRSYGGVERHVADLSGGLAGRGWKMGVLFPSGSLLKERLSPGVEARPMAGLKAVGGFLAGLRRVVRDFAPDVVHLHGPRATLLGRLALRGALGTARVLGTGGGAGQTPALLSTAHGWIPRRLALRGLYETAYLRTARLDDLTVAVSQDTARRYGSWARRLEVIPNGIERPDEMPERSSTGASGTPRTLGMPGAGLKAGFIGRLTEEKNFPLALEVLKDVERRLPDRYLELHVYGDGPLLEESRRATRHGPVVFHGWISPAGIPGLLSRLDLLLLTSREEGWPYVVLEAMAAGCPVVATAVGGLPEMLEDGESGFLFDPGDAAAGAEAVARLVETPGLARRVRQTAWSRVGEFSIEAMLDNVEQAYRSVLQGR